MSSRLLYSQEFIVCSTIFRVFPVREEVFLTSKRREGRRVIIPLTFLQLVVLLVIEEAGGGLMRRSCPLCNISSFASVLSVTASTVWSAEMTRKVCSLSSLPLLTGTASSSSRGISLLVVQRTLLWFSSLHSPTLTHQDSCL